MSGSVQRYVPVLEIGGTHVTAALVGDDGQAPVRTTRAALRSDAPADELLAAIAGAATGLGAEPDAEWGVAVPGPFDHEQGVGWFQGVGKFESLYGVAVGAELRARIRPAPARLTFLNDAHAFALGEYAAGAAAGIGEAVCLTLGTGVGSAFLAGGQPVTSGSAVPPEGRMDLVAYDGRPLEETVSRQAVRERFVRYGGRPDLDVREIAAAARAGDAPAVEVVRDCYTALGRAVAPYLIAFDAEAVVLGGATARSFDVIAPAVDAGIRAAGGPGGLLRPAARLDDAALLGAALAVRSHERLS